tara:strand:- start:2785 stop:3525 length:741 start_codon:yes stop_codon:yes gene_type:complete
MKNFNIITIFPDLIEYFSKTGFIKRASLKKLITINNINLRNYSEDKNLKVDDKTYGGGPGMVLQYQPIQKAISSIKNKGHIIYLSPQGKVLTQSKLHKLSNYNNLTLLCGRYEGIDERVFDDFIDEEISIGNYVVSGGEVSAMVLLEGIIRLLPGAIDDLESIKNDSFQNGLLDHPHYTRPDIINGKKIPEVLISGNHQEIEKWRRKNSLGVTWKKRPELLKNVKLSEEDDKLLKEYIAEHEANEN